MLLPDDGQLEAIRHHRRTLGAGTQILPFSDQLQNVAYTSSTLHSFAPPAATLRAVSTAWNTSHPRTSPTSTTSLHQVLKLQNPSGSRDAIQARYSECHHHLTSADSVALGSLARVRRPDPRCSQPHKTRTWARRSHLLFKPPTTASVRFFESTTPLVFVYPTCPISDSALDFTPRMQGDLCPYPQPIHHLLHLAKASLLSPLTRKSTPISTTTISLTGSPPSLEDPIQPLAS